MDENSIKKALKEDPLRFLYMFQSWEGILIGVFFLVTSFYGVKYLSNTDTPFKTIRDQMKSILSYAIPRWNILESNFLYYITGAFVVVLATIAWQKNAISGLYIGWLVVFVLFFILRKNPKTLSVEKNKSQAVISGIVSGFFISVLLIALPIFSTTDSGLGYKIAWFLILLYIAAGVILITPVVRKEGIPYRLEVYDPEKRKTDQKSTSDRIKKLEEENKALKEKQQQTDKKAREKK